MAVNKENISSEIRDIAQRAKSRDSLINNHNSDTEKLGPELEHIIKNYESEGYKYSNEELLSYWRELADYLKTPFLHYLIKKYPVNASLILEESRPGELDSSLIDTILELGTTYRSLFENVLLSFDKFKNFKIDRHLALKYIEKDFHPEFILHLVAKGEIPGLSFTQDLAEKLAITSMGSSALYKYIDEFPPLDQAVAEKLRDTGAYDVIVKGFNRFTGLKPQFLKSVEAGIMASAFGDDLVVELEEKFAKDRTFSSKIEKIREASREERPKLLQSFKQELRTYQEKWMEIIREAIQLLKKDPEIEKTTLQHWLEQVLLSKGMDPYPITTAAKGGDQTLIPVPREFHQFLRTFDTYQTYRTNLEKFIKKYKDEDGVVDEKRLFRDLYGHKPKGEIEIIKGPVNLHIRCWNLGDYILAYSEGEEITPKLKREALQSEGFSTQFKDLQITVERNEKGMSFEEEQAQIVYRHEVQHALYDIIEKHLPEVYRKDYNIRAALVAGDEESIKRVIKREMRQFSRKEFEARAKDEILAYYQEEEIPDPERILQILIKLEYQKGVYDYSHYWRQKKNREELTQKLFGNRYFEFKLPEGFNQEDFNLYISQGIREVFIKEYRQNIKQGIEVLQRLSNLYDKRRACALLAQEPLHLWQKVVDRLEGNKGVRSLSQKNL